MQRRWLVGYLGMCCFAATTHANDATIGGTPSAPRLVQATDVTMHSEHIDIYDAGESQGVVSISARYVFKNLSNQAQQVQMGFPEARADGEGEDPEAGYFRHLKVWVDQKPVQVQTLAANQQKAFRRLGLGRVHLFSVFFAPQAEVQVLHTYQVLRSQSNDFGVSYRYLTKTGALWAKPIAHAVFTLNFGGRPASLAFPMEYQLKSYFTTIEKGRVRTSVTFEMNDWTPKRNFELMAPTLNMFSASIPSSHCMSAYARWPEIKSLKEATASSAFAKQQNQQTLEAFSAPLKALSAAERQTCVNTVYAYYGRVFSDEALSRTFYRGPSYYRTATGIRPGELRGELYEPALKRPQAHAWTHVGFAQNQAYADALLSPNDHAFIAFVRSLAAH